MKTIRSVAILLGLLVIQSHGQTVQVLKRTRELNNQNNVRQGVTPPGQTPPSQPAGTQPVVAKPGAAATPQQKLAKIQVDLAGLKPGVTATAIQKQQLANDIMACARGTKPAMATVTNFVASLTAAVAGKTLSPSEHEGLARDIESVMNSASLPATQFNDIADHVQAILQVSSVQRNVAMEVAKSLKTVGAEVRGGGVK